jgi:fermentation-respiration switch protein FrsA (DUF1100 family)
LGPSSFDHVRAFRDHVAKRKVDHVDADRSSRLWGRERAPPTPRTPAYWADLNRYDAVAAAQKLTLPILLLHGERDYQVTARDHAMLASGLAAKPNVTAQEFPGLNHLFMAGEGPGRPEEYQHAGHVDQAVIDAVAAFMMKAPAR